MIVKDVESSTGGQLLNTHFTHPLCAMGGIHVENPSIFLVGNPLCATECSHADSPSNFLVDDPLCAVERSHADSPSIFLVSNPLHATGGSHVDGPSIFPVNDPLCAAGGSCVDCPLPNLCLGFTPVDNVHDFDYQWSIQSTQPEQADMTFNLLLGEGFLFADEDIGDGVHTSNLNIDLDGEFIVFALFFRC
jgi:hypothetical protein